MYQNRKWDAKRTQNYSEKNIVDSKLYRDTKKETRQRMPRTFERKKVNENEEDENKKLNMKCFSVRKKNAIEEAYAVHIRMANTNP